MSVIISDHTITTNNTTQKLLGGLKTAAPVRSPAVWVAIQNNHATASLYLKSTTADNATNAIIILAGEYKLVGPASATSIYNLDDLYIFGAASGHPYAIERMKS